MPEPESSDFHVIAFAGAANWPLWVGLERGRFAAEGLNVSLELTPNSRHMARSLFDGRAQVALTSIDNVVAYVEGQGAEPLEGTPDFFAFMGVDSGLLSLMARPGFERVEQLAGEAVSVDAPSTGFAFVLRELLQRAEAAPSQVVSVGSGAERLKALVAGEQAATLLNTPLDLVAEDQGCARLARALDVLGPYQGIVGAARRAWAADHHDQLVAFIRGFAAALDWLRDPACRSEAIRVLRAGMPEVSEAVAARAYELLVTEGGLTPDLRIDDEGVRCVLALRTRHGGGAAFAEPAKYQDLRYLMAATGRR